MNLKSKKRRIKSVRVKIRKIMQSADLLRLTVFRSHKYISAQIIDDRKGETLAAAGEKDVKEKGTKMERAGLVGQLLAERALGKKISKVVFDRGAYKYHGRVRSLAEGARQGGLKF